MHEFLQSLAHFFLSLGGLGALLLGILDSSFLMTPLGNDLLVVALTASNPSHMLYYVAMATLGSVGGVAIMHWVSSRTGKIAIEGEKKSKRVEFVERKVEQYGGVAIGVAALAPPPFPFTPFIAVPAALQYPLSRMLTIIGVCRAVRFFIEGWLAMRYGERILSLAQTPWLQGAVIALVVVAIVGSAFSILGWVRKSRQRTLATT